MMIIDDDRCALTVLSDSQLVFPVPEFSEITYHGIPNHVHRDMIMIAQLVITITSITIITAIMIDHDSRDLKSEFRNLFFKFTKYAYDNSQVNLKSQKKVPVTHEYG